MSNSTVAFIGLGHMGGPMAANLVKAGFTVRGYDVVPALLEQAAGTGVAVTGSIAEAAEGAESVITMLPTGEHVLDVYLGRRGGTPLVKAAAPGALLVDCSTIAVQDAREAARAGLDAGFRCADAPVSGGVVGAAAGTLTFMLGAAEADVEDIRALLEPMAGRIVHCGDNGNGQATKICNNMILASSQIAVAEAFVLGERLGLSHQALFDVVSTATGQCWALNTNCPVPGPVPTSPANRDYAPGFASPLMAKDLGLVLKAAETTGTNLEVGRLAAEIYREFADGPGKNLDFSGVIHRVRDASGA